MLTFLSPVFLAGVAAAAVPIVLHLLKREPEPRVKFAAVKLLKHAPVEHTQKHRLRELLLLMLRVATLVLLAVAFARPFFASGEAAGRGGVTVVALDTSYSMSAPGRFAKAQQLARDAIARAPAGDLVGVLLFDDAAEIVARPSADRVLATSAVDQAAAGFGATRYRAALSSATQAISAAAGRRATIVVVTDLQESGWDEGDRVAIPDSARVEIADVGDVPVDAAVTAVRPMPDRIVATLHNSGSRPRDVRAHLTIDGRPAGDATAALGPGQSADVTFPTAPRGAAAAVTIDDPGGIAADDVRYAALSGTSRPSVLIVNGSGSLAREAFYVQHALAAGGAGGRAYDVVALGGAELSSEQGDRDGRLSGHAAVFLTSTRGLERRGREALAAYLRAGGGLFIAAGPDVDGDVAADVLGGAESLTISPADGRTIARALAPTDLRHPIFRPFSGSVPTLALVRFQQAVRIEGAACQPLARFTTGGVALLECPAGEGRALVFASDLDNRWNDFPLHASFVPFVHETVRYLSAARAHASDYLVADAPAGVPRTPGVHDAPSSGSRPAARRIAINVDPREADAARLTVDEFQSAVTRLKDVGTAAARVEARQQEDDQHLWQYALALMVLTLAVEGVIASRTA